MHRPLRRLVPLLALAAAAGACHEDPVDGPVEPGDEAIGPEGGTFTAADGGLTLVIPAGALDSSVMITATPIFAPASLPVVPGTAWELGPRGLRFAEPVELTIRYDPARVTGDPADLRIAEIFGTAGELELAGAVGHDEAEHTVTGTIRGFSPWGIVMCTGGCLDPPDLTAEFEGATEGVALSWPTPTWSWVRIYRAVLRECEPGETSGEFGPYTCVSHTEVVTPPPECVAPDTASDGRPCTYTLYTQALGVSGSTRDLFLLGSRGAVAWYQARGGSDDNPLRAWSFPAQQVAWFGTPDPPEVPGNFKATPVSATAIRLDWQPTPTASGYELERLGPDGWSGTLPYSDFTFTDDSLVENTHYDYRIRSVNEHGVSAYATAGATTDSIGGGGTGANCEDFNLRLDFDPVGVAHGASDVVPVFIDRAPGFTGPIELRLVGEDPAPDFVLSTWAFNPNPVEAGTAASTLSFTGREDGPPAGSEHRFGLEGGSPTIANATSVCAIAINFKVKVAE
ncbi:MAG TPA: hypothetical protein VF188_08355 [Longimicrobiales bacterium]